MITHQRFAAGMLRSPRGSGLVTATAPMPGSSDGCWGPPGLRVEAEPWLWDLGGFRKVPWGLEGPWGGSAGCSEMVLGPFSVTTAPALLRGWEEGEEERGRGLLGLLQTSPAPCLAHPPGTRRFQGRGCRKPMQKAAA